MPKLKVSAKQKTLTHLKGIIDYHLRVRDMTKRELFLAMRMSEYCFYSRLRNPENFTLEELFLLANKLRISIFELLNIERTSL